MEIKSSAWPLASLLIQFAVAGAMTIKSAHFANSMWLMAASASVSHRLCLTGVPESACKVTFVTNWSAFLESTTWTLASSSLSFRTICGLLYAAIPPLIPNNMFVPLIIDIG